MSSPSSPRRQSSALLPAEAFSTDVDSDFLPWQIAFRVKFPSEKIGLRFHPAQFPDTGNGIYTIRLLELTKVRLYSINRHCNLHMIVLNRDLTEVGQLISTTSTYSLVRNT
ncbi:hypothetical protein V7S43_000475 [Phytophthora oleae]|uniref:Uncharacterized protein n=1 Tax=Phytophthora oleae TaxID=2107226 RepID=A0ABD3G8L2_9STRA